MAALASYARQSEDEALRRLAVRIQARALRRCSEVLREIEPAPGARTELEPRFGAEPRLTRTSAANGAGLSDRQRKTALWAGNIPDAEFEALIESDDPPTVSELAERGKSSRDHLRGRAPEDFAAATELLGLLSRFARSATEIDVAAATRGLSTAERCEIAGVEPQFKRLNGEDPAAFIVSVNLARRNLKKGQQAMALAMIYPDRTPGKKTRGSATALSETNKVSTARLSQARAVLRHSRALALAVLADTTPLDKAVEQVRAAEQRDASVTARKEELRAEAADLAALVDDERITLDDGIAALRQRQEQRRQAMRPGGAL